MTAWIARRVPTGDTNVNDFSPDAPLEAQGAESSVERVLTFNNHSRPCCARSKRSNQNSFASARPATFLKVGRERVQRGRGAEVPDRINTENASIRNNAGLLD
jgi:hypothetical protein